MLSVDFSLHSNAVLDALRQELSNGEYSFCIKNRNGSWTPVDLNVSLQKHVAEIRSRRKSAKGLKKAAAGQTRGHEI